MRWAFVLLRLGVWQALLLGVLRIRSEAALDPRGLNPALHCDATRNVLDDEPMLEETADRLRATRASLKPVPLTAMAGTRAEEQPTPHGATGVDRVTPTTSLEIMAASVCAQVLVEACARAARLSRSWSLTNRASRRQPDQCGPSSA